MKKIIIAICGVFLICAAYATVDVVQPEIQTAWTFSGDNPKNNVKDKYSVKKNNKYDFEYVNIVAATRIYEHGAEFCRIQLQRNYGNWKVYVVPESCQTICKENYYGTRCNSRTLGNCEHNKLTEIFDSNASPSPYKEESIDGFYSHENDAILLSVVSVTEHSIIVAPVEFYGSDEKRTKIASINTRGQSYQLCAQGYVLQGDTCVLMSSCNNGGIGENTGNSSCEQTKKSGVMDSGECKVCDTGWFFDKTQPNGCKKGKAISKEKMRDCFMETDPDEFKTCVNN